MYMLQKYIIRDFHRIIFVLAGRREICYVAVLTNIAVAINPYRNGIMVCIHRHTNK